ncbi:MAG: Do family serine endopeptidase [Hyphomicrobiaceae bacterium]
MIADNATNGSKRFGRSARFVAGGLLTAGALSLALLSSTAPTLAQRSGEPTTVQTPYGTAPLSFADIVDRVKPAVVSIHVTAGGPKIASRGRGRRGEPFQGFPGLPEDHPLNDLFKNLPRDGRPAPVPRPTLAQGSGFLISADGFVVTNNHVVDGATKVQVSFDENNKHDAQVIGTDPRTDLALLKIKSDRKDFPFVKFAGTPVRVGDWVLAVGNPFGLGGTVTAGIISALSRDIGSGPYDFLQIDAAVNRGNSGGPTFNLKGEVVGVNTAIYSPSGGNVGIAFAVPARTAAEVIQQLRASGSVSRGWLGVKIENVDTDKAASLGMSEAKGALVNEITKDGPAASSSLKAGDVIVSVNGSKVENSRDLARKIAEINPNTTVNLDVVRYGKSERVSVKLGTFPTKIDVAARSSEPEQDGAAGSKALPEIGLTLSTGTAKGGQDGVEIVEVDNASNAAVKGLKAGDVILDVQGRKVVSAADVETGIASARSSGRPAVLLRIKSGEAIRFVAVQLKKS